MRSAAAGLLLVVLAAPACFGDDPIVAQTDTTKPDTSTSDAGDAGDVGEDTPVTTLESLPNACTTAKPCSGGKTCHSGVCVTDPPESAAATITGTDNLPTSDPPDLSCVDQAPGTPAGPDMVTLYGAVARFGSGLKTYDIAVEVFLADTFDPSVCEAEPTDTKKANCYQTYGTAEGVGALPIGTGTSVPVDGAVQLPDNCNNVNGGTDHSVCPLGYRCVEGDLDYECVEQYGLYEIPNIPTNTMLVIRSRATTNLTKWHDSYTFNVYLFADEVEAGDRYHYDATMVSHGQWLLTPNTVGLADVPETHGVIGGRVRDCHSAARDSWPIAEISLDLARPAEKIVFFNDLEDDTVPLVDRRRTNVLGRFAALNIEPGWNWMSGAARYDGAVHPLGNAKVYVFPNALTLVTFPGLSPHWQQD